MTNYDCINQLNLDKMTIKISCGGECDHCMLQNRCDRLPLDRELVKQWLKSEVEE